MIKELVSLLQIPYNVTVAFQYKKLTLSDVFGRWLGMQLHLESCIKKSKTGLAKLLYGAMKNRNEHIFNNPLMSSALYLDPRFHFELQKYPEKVSQAKEHMLSIWRRLNILRTNSNASRQAEVCNVSSDSIDFDFDEMEAIAKHLQRGSRNAHEENENIPLQNCENDIEQIIDLYQPNQIPLNSSILSYWEDIKEEHNELYRIAMVVFSVPPTEVQIERDFSHLDCVFTKRRSNLCQSRLEEIFLIHLNPDLFHIVAKEELDDLSKHQDVEAS